MEPTSSEELLQFLRTHDTAVLATVTPTNQPNAATIYYYVEDDLRFYFLTKFETGKFKNIKENHSVALVISDPQTLQTVQVEGKAREVDYGGEYKETVKKFTDKLASSGKEWGNIPINHIKNSGYYVFVQVSPSWIRWVDYRDWEHNVKFEKTF